MIYIAKVQLGLSIYDIKAFSNQEKASEAVAKITKTIDYLYDFCIEIDTKAAKIYDEICNNKALDEDLIRRSRFIADYKAKNYQEILQDLNKNLEYCEELVTIFNMNLDFDEIKVYYSSVNYEE